MQKIKFLPKLRLLIIIFTAWQYFSVLGMAMLHWSNSLVWLNLGILLAFILLCPVYESLLLLILSIPFSVVIPNSHFDSLPMWRILYLALFAVWLARDKKFKIWEIKFLPWDKYLAAFIGLGFVLVLAFARFKAEGLKQIFFWLNVYLLYVVLINTLKSKQQIYETIRYAVWSLAIIVTLGFAQLFGYLFTNLDTFWVYWAANITKLYYGTGFAGVAMFSNSWFSYANGARELRMFSIMPDSQSFAYICLIALCVGTALTRSVFVHIRKWLWSGIRFAGLALILSGTRAVWVGMLAPLAAISAANYKNYQPHLVKKFLWPFIIVFLLFIASPLINKGLALMQVRKFQENFLSRAASIYNLNETSNQGRIKIWEESSYFAVTHPWGIGFGNFLVSFSPDSQGKSYGELANRLNTRYNLPGKDVSAHSLYLQVLVETGVLGLIIFMLFWGSVVKHLWEFIKHYRSQHDFLVYFAAQALLMVLWVMAAAIFDITLFNDKVLMFFLINLGIAGLISTRYREYEED
ncbi:MAG: O-antigen ligase family protein [Patescibacteria group bacterium]|nr:O-antigen ligase family protein [Patescibacteria group bacterium]